MAVQTMEEFARIARLHTKTVEETAVQREEARRHAQAGDKGKVTAGAWRRVSGSQTVQW